MISKNKTFLKSILLLLLFSIFIISCEDDTREVTLYEIGNTEANASSTNIGFGETVDFTSTSVKALTVNWTFEGGFPESSINPNVSVTYNTPGVYEAKLVVKYIDNTLETKLFTITVDGIDPPLPFGGTPITIDGTIEAENYDLGGEGVAYHDNEEDNLAVLNGSSVYRTDDGVDIEVGTPATSITNTNDGEWTNYTVNVTSEGVYNFDFRVASASTAGGKSVKLQLVNQSTGLVTNLGETGDFPNTGGGNVYINRVISNVPLTAGSNTLRFLFTGVGTNLDKVNVAIGVIAAPIDGLKIFSEKTITNSNLGIVPPVNNGNMAITIDSSNPNHGNSSLLYHYDPTGNGNPQPGYALSNMALTVSPYNASAYNFLHVAVKSSTSRNVRIRINTDSGNYWVVLRPATPAYGMLWDGAWHELVIPFTDLLANGTGAAISTVPAALSSFKQFTIRTDDADYSTAPNSFDFYIDDVYLTPN